MITFEHVSKTYANGVKGLDQVDLTIGDGDFVAVIGPVSYTHLTLPTNREV